MNGPLGMVRLVLLLASVLPGCDDSPGLRTQADSGIDAEVADQGQDARVDATVSLDHMPAGDFRLASGDAVGWDALADNGKALALIYVTATWCFTCGPEIEWLNEQLSADLPYVPVVVIVENSEFAVAAPRDGQIFQASFEPAFPLWVDTESLLLPYRRVGVVPVNFVVRLADLSIVDRFEGFTEERLEQAIERGLTAVEESP